jgi:hypothetical protein
LKMLGLIGHDLVYPTEQIDDKLIRRYVNRLLVWSETRRVTYSHVAVNKQLAPLVINLLILTHCATIIHDD